MAWRVANSLLTLLKQVNGAVPRRSKMNDGTIGDTAHASRASDHNPWVKDGSVGVVTAMDITHDPKNGLDSYALAETLRQGKDNRIKYVISNRRIFSSISSPWVWRSYNGANPHDCHVHISVSSEKSLYDLTRPWEIGKLVPQPNAPTVINYPLLKEGSFGPDVRNLQKMLGIPTSGTFDAATRLAVKSFQLKYGLGVDGIVGAYTWRELEKHPGSSQQTNIAYNIVATVFGGRGETERSAYDGHVISNTELGVALPARFSGKRPVVEVTNMVTKKSVICEIVDVGPWNTDDPYWTEANRRPQAEGGTDRSGRRTNRAGIDLSPAAARAIGLNGMGIVNWRFLPAQTPVA